MKINYCLPIIEKNKRDVIKIINENKNEYYYFEVWLDYITDVDEIFIDELINELKEKLIFLFRRQGLDPIQLPLQKRFSFMQQLTNSSSLLDLDITTQKEELAYIKENNLVIELILSYHDYQETPDDNNLNSIIKVMSSYKPTIYKLATMCNSENDSLRLLVLQQSLKQQTKKHIILGMSKFGTITRVYGTLWGNEMIFAPQKDTKQSAPGQLTKKQLENIFKELT